jgi:hypothetical protein
MKYIHQIDDLLNTNIRVSDPKGSNLFIKRPEQGCGLLWLKIRILMAWTCLIGKADAITFYETNIKI